MATEHDPVLVAAFEYGVKCGRAGQPRGLTRAAFTRPVDPSMRRELADRMPDLLAAAGVPPDHVTPRQQAYLDGVRQGLRQSASN